MRSPPISASAAAAPPPPPLLLLWLLAAAPAVAAAPTRGAANEVSGVAFEAVVFCQEAADTGLEEGDKHL
jgi:hypothetical protein